MQCAQAQPIIKAEPSSWLSRMIWATGNERKAKVSTLLPMSHEASKVTGDMAKFHINHIICKSEWRFISRKPHVEGGIELCRYGWY
jgi:hypothetical protein